MSETRHCWKCGTVYSLGGTPGRSETCERCNSDLKVCVNCVSYDARAAHQCRDRRAEPVEDKRLANFCDFFEFAHRVYVKSEDAFGTSREAKARDTLKKLFGD